MKNRRWVLLAALCSTVGMLPACALLTKSRPLMPRYFAPDVELSAAPPATTSPSHGEQRLRLGRVRAGAHLMERMVYRTSGSEIGYYEDRRWTERPESYLQRALSRSLFEQRGVTRVVSGIAPTLTAELVAFEEIKGDNHRARVEVVMSLDDAGVSVLERTIVVEVPVEGASDADPTPVVRALARALSDAVEQIGEQVVQQLAQLPPLPSEPISHHRTADPAETLTPPSGTARLP